MDNTKNKGKYRSSNKLGLAICENYFKELSSVVDSENNSNIEIYNIQTQCLNFSTANKEKVSERISNIKQNVEILNVLMPDDCAGSKINLCKKNCSKCHCHTICTELFISKPFLNQFIEDGYFIVTPGWLINWKDIVIDTWKLSEQNAKQFFNDSACKIGVLDTGVYDDYNKYLEEFSIFSGLEYKIYKVGINYFKLRIESIIDKWKLLNETNNAKVANKRIADYTMAFEILRKLSTLSSEKALLNNIFQLFNIIFSPQKMYYTPVFEGNSGELYEYNHTNVPESGLNNEKSIPDYEILKSQKGFKISAVYEGEVLGFIEIDDILFTEHIGSYTALTNSISSVLGFLIYNAREYGKVLKEKIEILETSENNLKLKNEELQTLYMELQASEEEIRSSNEELRATADELIEINAQLEKAKQKAEESDSLKTAFLNNMSHEIRTPLNAILGFSSILPDYFNDKAKLKCFSDIIDNRGKDLLEIIDGILDIAKIESGQMTINTEVSDLGLLLKDIEVFFKEYQTQIKKEHISFTVNNPFRNTKKFIITDSGKLKQIFINLINNAFKFTSKGKIKVGLHVETNRFLTFFVSDTGIGISKERHAEIFNRFIQVEDGISRLYGGTGLGLSIVKGLLKLLEGKIWLESEPDQGTTFYFSIPLKEPESVSKNNVISARKFINENIKAVILIVEDDFYNTEYLKEILSDTNYEILHTMYGREAVEISEKRELDVVLMDVRLPDISGHEATKIIKTQNPNVKIIAQTAYATSVDQNNALQSGCDDYISKPIKKESLLEKINQFVLLTG